MFHFHIILVAVVCCAIGSKLKTNFLRRTHLTRTAERKVQRAQTKQYQSVCLYLRFIQTKQFVCFSISFKRNLSLSVSLFHSNEISGCVFLTLSLSLFHSYEINLRIYVCFLRTKSLFVSSCYCFVHPKPLFVCSQ
jgi:hypothetical protein